MHSGREVLRSRDDRGIGIVPQHRAHDRGMVGVDVPDLSDDRHTAHGGEDGNRPIDRQSKIDFCPRHGRAAAMGTAR